MIGHKELVLLTRDIREASIAAGGVYQPLGFYVKVARALIEDGYKQVTK